MEQSNADGPDMTKDVDSVDKGTQPNAKTNRAESKSPVVITKEVTKPSCKKHGKTISKKQASKKKKTKAKVARTSEDSTSTSDPSEEEDTATSSSSSDSEDVMESARKTRLRAKLRGKKAKDKSRSKTKVELLSESDSSTVTESESDTPRKVKSKIARAKARKATKKVAEDSEDSEDEEDRNDDDDGGHGQMTISKLMMLKEAGMSWPQIHQQIAARRQLGGNKSRQKNRVIDLGDGKKKTNKKKKQKQKQKHKAAAASKVAFKRVDQLWDNALHDYKLTETIDNEDADKFDQYIFTVRRKFDWEHKYQDTFVDIKSKFLKEVLANVMHGVRSVSMHVAVPKIDPNMLFLYLEELRQKHKEWKAAGKSEKKSKARKSAAIKAKHLRVLIKYLDSDYADTKKNLYPLLEKGQITFDLLWALYKPGTIAYTSTYGDHEEPRAFKIEYATKEQAFTKGTWYAIEGKYLEYSGKTFGMGKMNADVPSFKGVRSITSLECYPLSHHKNAEQLKSQLIERGKKFIALSGSLYKFHQGIAYCKKRKQILRICINGRVMIDSAIFRRINPNYSMSTVKPKEEDEKELSSEEESDAESCTCGDSGSEGGSRHEKDDLEDEPRRRRHFRVVKDDSGHRQVVEIEYDESTGEEIMPEQKLEETSDEGTVDFTDEELLIASPVVLGFSFNEKLWLEFSVSGVKEIEWNNGAFESLVLPPNQKRIVKALVSAHKFHPKKNIDDIIANKGLGCTMLLHGPPGTGKTLTAEGIAELLKAPLYMVSAGELGQDARTLERELQNILDISHSWGAVLLLDEADVFMEKRSLHDIHRNALVGIFLRLLEYFQGILFLTTNRVETFDDAFQSRIHVALRYNELPFDARRSVWKMFIEKIRAVPDNEIGTFDDADLDKLARRAINGRQIKNTARAAQALAVDEGIPLSMSHVEEVLRVSQSFEQDLKGGTGYEDVMRSYT